MSTSDQFNVLIVEPDSASRGVLKQAVSALTTFRKLFAVGSIEEANSYTTFGEKVDVVILAKSLPLEEVKKFIHDSRATKRGAEWAYIRILSAKNKGGEDITTTFVEGVDGFLNEPYSAEDIREIAEVAARIKLLNEENRKRSVIRDDLREMLAHIDAICAYATCAEDVSVPLSRLRAAAQRIDKNRKQYSEIYFDMLIEETAKAQPNMAKSYLGPSERIKRRMRERTLKSMNDAYKR